MSKDKGKADSEEVNSAKQQMLDHLNRLQKQKKILTENLWQIDNKFIDLKDKIERKTSRYAAQMEANNTLLEQLSRLRCESTVLEQSIKRVETIITENRNSVEQLVQKLDKNRQQKTKALNQTDGQMGEIAQHFKQLTINSVSEQKSPNNSEIEDQIKDQISRLDQQIKAAIIRRESLLEELSRAKDSLDPVLDNSTVGSERTEFDYQWNDWPIRHRMITLELFANENQLIVEDLEMIQKI